jgi:hypothetical protein
MALLAEHIPEHRREFVRLIVEAHALGTLDQGILGLADRGNPGQVALDVGGKHRHAGARQPFSENLQSDRLAGAGCTRDETMTVGEGKRHQRRLLALADKNHAVFIDFGHRHPLNLLTGLC